LHYMENIKIAEQKLDSTALDHPDGRRRITCRETLQISEECNVSPEDVGKLCDERKIKIIKCKLGCF